MRGGRAAVPRVKGETSKFSVPGTCAGGMAKRAVDVAARGQPSGGSRQSRVTHRVALGADQAGKGTRRKRCQPPSGAGETEPDSGLQATPYAANTQHPPS